MIHMTATTTHPDGKVSVGCRPFCGWESGPHPDLQAARNAGDAHLAVANAPHAD